MVEKHSELSGNTYAIFIPTLNPEEPFILPKHRVIVHHFFSPFSSIDKHFRF